MVYPPKDGHMQYNVWQLLGQHFPIHCELQEISGVNQSNALHDGSDAASRCQYCSDLLIRTLDDVRRRSFSGVNPRREKHYLLLVVAPEVRRVTDGQQVHSSLLLHSHTDRLTSVSVLPPSDLL